MRTVPWFDFKHPDYPRVLKKRLAVMQKIEGLEPDEHKRVVAGLHKFYADHPVEFIEDWMITYDPRTDDKYFPFILFPVQERFIEWLHDKYLKREDGLTEKSRDAGATWLCCAFAVWAWKFHSGSAIGFGSRKEKLVDNIGDPDSIFEKMRMIIRFLPDFLRPAYDPAYLKIRNMDNGSIIAGEGGDNIGRGGRKTIYFKDESAHYERPDKIDAALSQNSPCKIDISTPNGTNNLFYVKRMGGKIDIFTFSWKDDPRKDQAWYDAEKAKTPAHIFAQEVDIDYHSATTGLLFKPEWIQAAIGFKGVPAEGIAKGAMDVADEGGDDNTLFIGVGLAINHIEAWKELNTTKSARRSNFICKEKGVDLFRYDIIGVGSGVKGELNSLEESNSLTFTKVVPFDSRRKPTPGYYVKPSKSDPKGRRNRDMFENLRAQAFWTLADRFKRTWEHVNGIVTHPEDEMLSLPDDPEYKELMPQLIAELCSIKYTLNGAGKVLIESKKDMNFASPNLADGISIYYAPMLKTDTSASDFPRPVSNKGENCWSGVQEKYVPKNRRNILSSPYYPRG